MNDNPLVSILLIAYNSSKFVLEALESCKNQTYKNIELVVSDDCSTDNTVEICRRWIDENGERFPQVQLLTVEKNTGIVGNCKRAAAAAQGKWLKWFAGDDIFPPESIQEYINYVQIHPDAKFCVADCIHFKGDFKDKVFRYERLAPRKMFFGKHITARQQFKIVSHIFVGSGPGNFYNREAYESIGGYDSRFPLQEDHAFYIKLTKNGYKLHLVEKYLVYYRENSDSVCHKGSSGKIFSPQHIRYIREYKFQYMTENLNWFWRVCMRYSLTIRNKIIDNGNSFDRIKCRFYYKLYMSFDPFINYGRFLKLVDLF